MITQQQARSMLNHPVHDAEGVRIGKADHVYLDDATGKPQWVSVRTGWFGSSESFVPIGDAKVVDDHLQVPYPKEKVKAAPMVALEEGGHLARREERRLYQHYGIATGNGGRAAERTAAGGGTTAPAVAPAGSPLVTPTPAAARSGDRRGWDGAMTRSEERMSVGVERYESGHAKLHKYVVTEEERQTVPVRHEEVRVEHEPITDANRGAAMSGEPIAEAEHEVTLHAERAVVRTEAVPVERVRLVTEERVEQQTVTGQVRKERIEADLPGGKEGIRGKETPRR
ncbi:PRC and DUF2382 domain-containing protein [Streptomyces sp. Y1]|uniref:PRC and DUF2382 domain-containing protein n=1 Tax=Streptomyces sp. Y1 TaxID=3238634 RepID=A0AB39TK46_9ACTN